jgi:uncharacterized protein YfaS (alpha-2-macroglobulin family)
MPPGSHSTSPKKSYYGIAALALLFGIAALLLHLERPTGSLQGRVVGPDGKPIVGATVSLDAYPHNYDVKTDENGKFSAAQIAVREYYYQVRAKGYQTYYPAYPANRLAILEGQALDVGTITLQELPPSFYAEMWDDTKTPGEKVVLSINGAKIQQVHFTLHRLDLLEYLKKGGTLDKLKEESFDPNTLPADSKAKDWIEEIPAEEISEFNRKVRVPDPEKGLYLIHAVAASADRKNVFTRNLVFSVTDLGFLAKRDQQSLLIFASTFLQPKPVGGAKVYVFDQGQVLAEAATENSGLVRIELPPGKLAESTTPLIVLSFEGSQAYLQGPSLYMEDYGGEGEESEAGAEEGAETAPSLPSKLFIYTERPLYRPGQKVYFKGIARAETPSGGYQVLPSESVHVSITNPKGDIVHEENVSTNAFGSFWGAFDLEEEGGLGYYNIVAEFRGREFTKDFEVEEYRKPEFKLDIQPDKERYHPGDKITFHLDTQYYFGAPLETEVEYTLYKSPYYYSGPEDEPYDSYHYGYEPVGGYGDFLQEGKVRTDTNGKATVTLTAPEGPEDQRITLRGTAKDLTERTVTRENDAYVVGGDFYFRTQATEFLGRAGTPYRLTVVTRDYQNKPVSQAFQVAVEREKWDPFTSNYKYKKTSSVEGKTSAEGRGQVDLQFEQGGYYRLALSGKDREGRKVVFHDYLWVSGRAKEEGGFGLEKNMVAIADKKKFQAGETAKIFIVGPVQDGTVLLTVEGTRIHEHRLVQLEGFSKEIEVELKKEWIPNVHVSVSAIGKREYYQSTTELAISPQENYLQVEIQSDAQKYRPGQEVVYKITAKDNAGKPVSAELSLGVVDESLYALKEDSTNIKEFFWGPKPNRVGTAFSFSGYYSGGLEKEDQRLLRKNFKDTAFWNPSLVTDANGRAEARVLLPDNLTTWRATVLAQTAETHVGQQTQKVIASKDLIARLAIPRFFTERDRVTLKALVQNYTEKDQVLQASLDLKGLEFVDPQNAKTRSLNVAAKQTVAFEVEVLAKTPGQATIQFLAKNDQVNDGFELKIPILPYGNEDHQYHQGEIVPLGAPANVAMNVPPQSHLASAKLSVTVDSSLFAQLLGPVTYLVEYPYGCVEQSTSRMLSALTVAELYKTLGISDAMVEKKIPRVVKKGIARVTGMQHSDGGWGWWKDDPTDPYMTAYALYGLIRAQALGQSVDAELVKRGKDALGKMLKEGLPTLPQYNAAQTNETRYFIHYVASLAGIPNQPLVPQGKPVGTHLASIYLSLALNAQGRNAEALTLVETLKRDLNCQGGLCHLSDAGTYVGDAEVTAWGLRAWLHVLPGDQATIEAMVKWLLQARVGGIWRQTRETAAVVYALAEYAQSVPSTKAGVKVLLTLNGKELEQVNVASPHFVRKFVQPPLKEGGNAFALTNLAEHQLYYQTDLSYYSQQDPLAPSVSGIKVTREYVRLKGERDSGSGEVKYNAGELKGAIAKGETIGVRLTVENSQPLSFVVIEDPLPSGFEVVDNVRFDEKAAYYTETEVHDEKVALFMTYMGEGQRIFNYAIRPELPGFIYAMPTKASQMYQPEVRGASGSVKLEVK